MPNGCVELRGRKQKNKYGHATFRVGGRNGRSRSAHRVAYELAYGPIPEGKWVLHTCDNPRCVAAEHLYLGTHADNMRDMREKGRGHHPTVCKHGHALTADNTYIITRNRKVGKRIERVCKQCHRRRTTGLAL